MDQQLINRINNTQKSKLIYNTACLEVTDGNDYTYVYEQLMEFVSKTTKEPGCLEFYVVPSNLDKKEFMLWEIWETVSAFDKHMEMDYTKKILSKNIISLQWNDYVDNFYTSN